MKASNLSEMLVPACQSIRVISETEPFTATAMKFYNVAHVPLPFELRHKAAWNTQIVSGNIRLKTGIRTAMRNTEHFSLESNKILHSHNKRRPGTGRGEINNASVTSPAT